MDALQLTLLEKDKYISSLEWQLVDSEATITSVQAERDRLALELDCALVREQDSDLQALGAVGDLSGYSEPVEHTNYGLVESGYVDDMPVRRVRKQPRRHLSDLTTRGNSYFDDFGAILAGHVSLSDYDVPTLAEKESHGLGNLKRATNFSNINNLDGIERFDKRPPLSPKVPGWESFDDSDAGLSPVLNKDKWNGFSDVSNIEGDQTNEPKIDNEDMWTFTPDSILNVSTGRSASHYTVFQYKLELFFFVTLDPDNLDQKLFTYPWSDTLILPLIPILELPNFGNQLSFLFEFRNIGISPYLSIMYM